MKNLALFLLISVAHVLHAQVTEIGLSAGLTSYSGDLTPEEFGLFVKDFRPAYGAFIRFHPTDRLGVRIAFNGGQVAADDKYSAHPERGLNFRTSIMELALLAEIETLRFGNRRTGSYLSLYLFAGGGVYRFEPETLFEGNYVSLQPIGTEGQGLPLYEQPYRLTQANIPIGAGLKYVINSQFTIALEIGGRKLFTDYLDDVGHINVNYEDIRKGKGEIAARLSYPNWEVLGGPDVYRRGGVFNDWYYISGITLSYFLDSDRGGQGARGNSRGTGCYDFGRKSRR